MLGAWLGDGTTGLGGMTSHPMMHRSCAASSRTAGFETTTLADDYSFGVTGLRAQLRDIGVLEHKHIPAQYLRGSVGSGWRCFRG